MGSLRIAFLASELTPFAKTGGLADVAASLPRTLGNLGHDVRVFVPLYGSIDRVAYELIEVGLAGRGELVPSLSHGVDGLPIPSG